MTKYHRRLLLLLLFYSIHAAWANGSQSSAERSPKVVNKLKSTQTDCTKDHFHIQLDLGKPFKGIVFAKEFSDECRVKGNSSSTIELTLPTSSCGVRMIPRPNDMMEMAVKLVIQMDGKLRQQVDMEKNIRCIIPSKMMDVDMTNMMGGHVVEKKRNGRMRTEVGLVEPRIRVWMELGATDGSDSVEVGEATTLGIRALLPSNIGVRVTDCSAMDGLAETSQKLVDARGCPTDEQVMPALLVRHRPAEEGWSKSTEDELVEKLFTTTFPAFKFPDRERLHIQCTIRLCNGNCPRVDCKRDDSHQINVEQQLAQIDVFNSLAITAPQIEIDRLQQRDKRHETGSTSSRGFSEGVLCVSYSKLAISFAILGVIFLIAVIVAVICMLKARMSKREARESGTSIFSSSSSSMGSHNSRTFGTKLLIPYGTGSLPYGRVY